jgi:serine/threonine-protein kinase
MGECRVTLVPDEAPVTANCPDSNTLNELASGTLDGARRESVLLHLDACAECRRVAALAAGGRADEPGAQLRPGERFAGYVIVELLGAGAMGLVYAARDEELQRTVALKLVRPSTAAASDEASARERLLREAKAAAGLSHPNVVVVHEVGTFDGQVFIAMELVEISLADWLAGAPRATGEILEMFVKAGEGLAAAHDAGVVHRDFKPDNVLVGRDGRPRVADFGVARQVSEPALPNAPATSGGSTSGGPFAGTVSLTQTGALVGTPAYMAPEQARGIADARSDQFAFAVSLYECLYGERPFERRYAPSIEREQRPRMRPTARGGRVPTHVRRALLRAMSTDPRERFPDMRSLLRALAEPPERSIARQVPATLLVALAGLVLAAVVSPLASRTSGAASSSETAAASVPPTVKLIDLPIPASDVAEAKGEYVAGIQALHDGSVVPGLAHLTRAVELDASMAAAHLRLAVYGRDVQLPVRASSSFARARELRSLLTTRDQALLAAMEPSFLAVPPDPEETARRLAALAAESPADVELQYVVAARERDPREQVELLGRVADVDPAFALALWHKAAIVLSLADYPTAVETLERCVSVSPSSTSCLTVLSLVDEELGRCEEMERHARVLAKVSPSARSHDLVARALLANGAPVDAVREALQRKWSAAKDAERDGYRNADETNLAILAGDFTTAERLERRAADAVERSADEDDHKNTIVPLVELYGEMGRTPQAGRVADQYLRARAAWESIKGWAPVPLMLAAAVHAGIRTERERRAARDEWLRQWDSMDTSLRGQSWVLGFAGPATTPAEGREALDAAPQPLPRAHTNQFHREGFGDPGKVLLLAGKTADALPLLRVAASSCSALPAPLDHTWASLNLGLALEATGDGAGACAAYRVVLERWGAARPRSITADRARTRSAALGCAASPRP